MFTKIRVISIPVINQQVALEFYRDVLGARVEVDMPFDQQGAQRGSCCSAPASTRALPS